jgi:MYXO-CTERM domain-containing protein
MISAGFALVLGFGGLAPLVSTDRFEAQLQEDVLGIRDVSFDSDWFPPDSPVQLRLLVHAADTILIEMPGEARYDWAAGTIAVAGDVREGSFTIDLGAQLHASVRFDVAGIQWESDLLGPYDFATTSTADFTPYLLPGNPDRPVQIEDATDGVTVASVPIVPDILVASGGLDIDVAAAVSAELSGVRVDMTTGLGTMAAIDAEGVAQPLAADEGTGPLLAAGVLVADLQTTPTIIVRPHLVMSILGQDYEIFGIDIPVDLPAIDDQIAFAQQPLSFDRPPEPPADPDSGEGSEGTGVDDGGGVDESTSGGPIDASSDEDGSDTEGPAIDELDSGCSCRTTGPDPVGLGLALFGLMGLALRRRRPHG